MIGPSIQAERKRQKLTLEQLAGRSGVSKSMLSQIERGEANPTFAVLWSLTTALEIDLSDLIGGGLATRQSKQMEVMPLTHTAAISSADRLCRLKILSPPHLAGRTEWYDIQFQPGGKLESDPHTHNAFEHFTALTDNIEVTSGGNAMQLKCGETARYPADVPHAIVNTGDTVARGFLVLLYG